MGWFDHAEDSYNQVQNDPNQASWSHELIAGAAAYEGMKAYENHEVTEGKPENHEFAKELVAGFAGAEADRLAETKGLDFADKEEAKWKARKQAKHIYNERNPDAVGQGDYDRGDDQYGQQNQNYQSGNYGF